MMKYADARRAIVIATLILGVCGGSAFSAPTAGRALPCQLTESDYSSIAQGNLHLTKADIDNLSEGDKRELCRTRLLLKVASGKSVDELKQACSNGDVPIGLRRYASPDESASLREFVSFEMASMIGSPTSPPKCTAALGPSLK